MQQANKGQTGTLEGAGLDIGIVRARFNDEITSAMADACLAELAAMGVEDKQITQVTVPGALEIPVALKAMADSENFDALVALGCVIRGETFHFELVAMQSGTGLSQVALEYVVPIANAILTVESQAQAWERAADKGKEAARVAVEMANLLDDLL